MEAARFQQSLDLTLEASQPDARQKSRVGQTFGPDPYCDPVPLQPSQLLHEASRQLRRASRAAEPVLVSNPAPTLLVVWQRLTHRS